MGWLPGYEDWRLAKSAQLPDSVLLKSLQVVRSQLDAVQAVQKTCEGAGSPDSKPLSQRQTTRSEGRL